jgi:hypothetical protein
VIKMDPKNNKTTSSDAPLGSTMSPGVTGTQTPPSDLGATSAASPPVSSASTTMSEPPVSSVSEQTVSESSVSELETSDPESVEPGTSSGTDVSEPAAEDEDVATSTGPTE